jgi:hypothetical protein
MRIRMKALAWALMVALYDLDPRSRDEWERTE